MADSKNAECGSVCLPKSDHSHTYSVSAVGTNAEKVPQNQWEQEKPMWFKTEAWYNRLEQSEISVYLSIHVSPCIMYELTFYEELYKEKTPGDTN